jgi:hypothetical protein
MENPMTDGMRKAAKELVDITDSGLTAVAKAIGAPRSDFNEEQGLKLSQVFESIIEAHVGPELDALRAEITRQQERAERAIKIAANMWVDECWISDYDKATAICFAKEIEEALTQKEPTNGR